MERDASFTWGTQSVQRKGAEGVVSTLGLGNTKCDLEFHCFLGRREKGSTVSFPLLARSLGGRFFPGRRYIVTYARKVDTRALKRITRDRYGRE